jgi:hypothetical protein
MRDLLPRAGVALLPAFLPIAVRWVRARERKALARGAPLDASQIALARAAGILAPGRVRLEKVDAIPISEHRWLGKLLPDVFGDTVGLTLRYGILIRRECWGDRRLIAHELAHVAQYERFGGVRPFLRRYFRECLLDGYPFGPLEREAIAFASRVPGRW